MIFFLSTLAGEEFEIHIAARGLKEGIRMINTLKKRTKDFISRCINEASVEIKNDIIDAVLHKQQELQMMFTEIAQDVTYRDAYKKIWLGNLHTEYEDWDRVIQEWSKSDSGIAWATYRNSNVIPNEIQRLLPSSGPEPYRICDVGSGPRCWMGNVIEGGGCVCELVCCDPLAEYYEESFARYGIQQTVPIVKVDGENLLEKFEYNSFDVVAARNSLDHSYSPEQCILQMGSVSKKYVYLLHCINEGKNANYNGLHNWDFDYRQGNFIIESVAGTVNFSKKYSHLFGFSVRTFDKEWNGIMQHWLEIILDKEPKKT
jgi:hypothetical protein